MVSGEAGAGTVLGKRWGRGQFFRHCRAMVEGAYLEPPPDGPERKMQRLMARREALRQRPGELRRQFRTSRRVGQAIDGLLRPGRPRRPSFDLQRRRERMRPNTADVRSTAGSSFRGCPGVRGAPRLRRPPFGNRPRRGLERNRCPKCKIKIRRDVASAQQTQRCAEPAARRHDRRPVVWMTLPQTP